MPCGSTNSKPKKDAIIIKPVLNVGRGQFFYHSPSSPLPIRDVLNEQNKGNKTEPHIEIGAENYWSSCLQSNNIRPLLENGEKYLFLMTTCRNKKLPHYGKRYIVGYIVNEEHGKNAKGNNVYFVKGKTYLYSFEDSYEYSIKIRTKRMDETETERILNHFNGRRNILRECIDEIKRVDKNSMTCLRVRDASTCKFAGECLRWNQS